MREVICGRRRLLPIEFASEILYNKAMDRDENIASSGEASGRQVHRGCGSARQTAAEADRRRVLVQPGESEAEGSALSDAVGASACFCWLKSHRHSGALLLYGIVILLLYFFPGVFHPRSAEDVRLWVTGFGIWGPLAYVFLYTVRPVLLFPGLLLNLAAGVLFSPQMGIPCVLFGGLGSASLLFYMARTGVGTRFFDLHGGRWGSRIHRYLSDREKGFVHMLWLRTVPLFPYDLISLLAGGTRLDYRSFAAATFVGMFPGAVAYNMLGEALGGNRGLGPSLLLTAVAFGLPLFFWYRGEGRKRF